jgi:hypothetical protein
MAEDHRACFAAVFVQPEQIADFPWRTVPNEALKDFQRPWRGGSVADRRS